MKAIELSPGLAEAHYAMGVLLILQSQPGAAAQELRKALEIKPDYAEVKARLENLSPSPSR